MTRAHRRYLAVEMAVAAAINTVLSAVFCLAVFGGRSEIAVAGLHGVVIDAAPQSFMIALMSCLVPTILTRRRIASGSVAPRNVSVPLPRSVVLRALVVAGVAALLAVVAQAIILPRFGASMSFGQLIAFKCMYGALLGAGIAALAICAALGDRRSRAI